MKSRMYKKILGWMLTVSMIFSVLPALAVYAEEGTAVQEAISDEEEAQEGEEGSEEEAAEEQLIQIHNAQELQELAQNCKVDAWSANVRVELCGDISLEGIEFEPIQIFSGTFDGKGYTISGFSLTGEGYADGFFRHVEETAVIQNLTISGVIESENEQECVGGICGINRGVLMNCEFIGVVKGQNSVGGIAGENESTGVISNCHSYGSINGSDGVGGIAGKNHGSIMTCDNQAGINNDSAGVEERDSEGLEWILDAAQTDDARLRSNIDVGGIAGYSDGIITYCRNTGVVGYEHVGYNIGGIAGRQSGLLTYCTNTGEVYGRKDVGGIVGQMEPFISVDEAESISVAVQTLHDQINKLLDDLDRTQSVLNSDFDELKGYSDSALDHGESISDRLVDFTDDNIGSINSIAANMDYVIDRLPEILDHTHNAMDGMSEVSEDMKKLNEDLDVIDQLQDSEYSETDYKRLSIVTGVGGNVTSDNVNPEQGTVVTLTSNADNGYRLKTLTVTDAAGANVACTQSAGNRNEYTFTMPQENVVVKAEYEYTGAYLASSNAGGNLYLSVNHNSNTVKISVTPDGGYHFDGVYVGADYYDKSLFTLDDSVYTLEIMKQEPGVPVIVSTTFVKDNDSHKITNASSTGGYLTVDKDNASPGETVTVTVHEEADYMLSSLTMNGSALTPSQTANEYTFRMPQADAEVLASFSYQPDADTEVYTESDIGGTVVAVRNIGSNDYTVVITPGSGYQVSDSALSITGSGQSAVTVNKTNLTRNGNGDSYTYTVNKNSYNNPIRVYGYFEKLSDTHSVSVTDGTGGRASADQSSAAAGDTITVTAQPQSGYRLSGLTIRSGGTDISCQEKSADHTYEFTMPNGNVDIVAEFEPVQLIVVSNAGGKADSSVDGTTVTLTVSPNTGYTLSGHPVVTDNNGNNLPVSRKNAGSYVYEFTVERTMEPVKIEITFVTSSDYDTVQDAGDRINVNTEILQDSMNQASNTVDKIETLTKDEYGNTIPAEDFLNDSEKVDELAELLLELADELTDAGEAASAIISDLNTIANVLTPYVEGAADQANTDIDEALDDLEKVLDELKKASDGLEGIIDYLSAQEEIRMSSLGGDFSSEVDALFDDLDRISDCMGRLGDHIDSYSDLISQDLRAINDQMNKVFQLFVDKMDDVENRYLEDDSYDDIESEDVSDEEIEETTNGKVEKCSNEGKVEGDVNVGGIAGSMAIDEEDPEDNAAGKVERSLGNKYLTRCVMIGCVNNGNILSKKDGVGCIAGYMDLGVIMECEAYGTAESTEGEYIGGICGQSFGIIKNSYSLCSLTGSRYVGGIAGYGYKIQNCYSMTLIDPDAERVGAISGRIDMDEDDERKIDPENVCGNYFVSSRLNGIDDISYVGVAEPVPYAELLETAGLPYTYRHLKINFVVDGITIRQTEAAYGDSLEEIEYPEIPAVSGCFGVWSIPAYDYVEGNITIEAEYQDNIITLISKEGVASSGEDASPERPYALADGIFDDSAVLHANVSDMEMPEDLVKHHDYVVYDISLEGIQPEKEQETRVRLYHAFEGDVRVLQYVNDNWEEVDAKNYGSYEQVLMHGTQGTFCIVSDTSSKLWIIILAGGAAGVLVLAVLIKGIRKRRKKKKSSS